MRVCGVRGSTLGDEVEEQAGGSKSFDSVFFSLEVQERRKVKEVVKAPGGHCEISVYGRRFYYFGGKCGGGVRCGTDMATRGDRYLRF